VKNSASTKYTHNINSHITVRFLLYKGMQYIQGHNRHKTTFSTVDDQAEAGNPVELKAVAACCKSTCEAGCR
jgi:hypothetical protein